MPPPGFSHTLSFISQISKILPFLEVNTGSIFIAPLKNFLPTPLNVYFPLGQRSQPVVAAQPEKRLGNKIKKGALRWCVWTSASQPFYGLWPPSGDSQHRWPVCSFVTMIFI